MLKKLGLASVIFNKLLPKSKCITGFESDVNKWEILRSILSGSPIPLMTNSEWDKVAETATANNLSGTTWQYSMECNSVPDVIRSNLKQSFLVDAGRCMLFDNILKDLLELFSNKGIYCTPIKGAVFRHLLYKDPGYRPSIDIDLIVKKSDYLRSLDLMESSGYVRNESAEDRPVTSRRLYEYAFTSPVSDPSVIVEIHCAFGNEDRFRIDYDAVWDRSLSIKQFLERVGGKGLDPGPLRNAIVVLSPEDALVHQFVHNAVHCFDIPVMSLLDVRLILERWKPRWDVVLDLCHQWGVTAAGYFTLRMARDCLEANVPEEALFALEPSLLRRTWLELFISTEGEPPPDDRGEPVVTFFRHTHHLRLQQVLVGLPLIDGPFNALRYCASYLILRLQDLLARMFC